jgi:AAA15 family ATPase/GTPase
MAIKRVEIKDFLVFNGEFGVDFCPGVNVLIGGNGTGKTTLLKLLCVEYRGRFAGRGVDEMIEAYFGKNTPYDSENVTITPDDAAFNMEFNLPGDVYIPEKDILEHAKGLITFIEEKQTGFGEIYRDILIKAQDVPTKNQTSIQKHIGETISKIIGGKVQWVQGDGSFYTIKTDGTRIPFANEASGFKKLGLLGLLVACGQLKSGSILYWDEPENSLNPELLPVLVDVLLELQRGGVQIFLATHSELLASYFAANRTGNDSVMFYSLYKDDEQIKADKSERFDLLTPNNLKAEPVKLYEKEIERWLGNE